FESIGNDQRCAIKTWLASTNCPPALTVGLVSIDVPKVILSGSPVTMSLLERRIRYRLAVSPVPPENTIHRSWIQSAALVSRPGRVMAEVGNPNRRKTCIISTARLGPPLNGTIHQSKIRFFAPLTISRLESGDQIGS